MGITQPDAKIELRHLETIKRPPATGKTRAQLFANGDLVIFLSKQDSRNWPLEGIKIERTSIETPLMILTAVSGVTVAFMSVRLYLKDKIDRI